MLPQPAQTSCGGTGFIIKFGGYFLLPPGRRDRLGPVKGEQAHIKSGRRHLRIDLAGAEVADPSVLGRLRDLHAMLIGTGGMLVFDNPGPVAAALHAHGLFADSPY